MIENLSLDNVDVLYPYRAELVDVYREFRDSTQYFIDGDSLLLSVAHHINVDLNSYYGNTLHVIFIIERMLLTLFQQSDQCNYTLIFFDCHYHLYQQEKSILSLLRSCLIAHLSQNANKYRATKIQQFSSWLNDDYLSFTQNEKPFFVFYHDMSTFDLENGSFLSKDVLEKLLCMYRLFGNYHQYEIKCQLYLMNKLTLTETIVKCFHVEFKQKAPMELLMKVIELVPKRLISSVQKETNQNEFEKSYQDIDENDGRLFIYLKTISNFIQNNQEQHLIELLNPLLVLHVALLIHLSLSDRHLLASLPSITFSPIFSQLIIQFQHHLSSCLSSSFPSSLSCSKIADIFDGRLFAFTLYQIYQSSSHIRLDSKTSDIVQQSLTLLNIPSTDNMFQNIVKHLIESNNITPSSLDKEIVSNNQSPQRHKIISISNSFIDTYLKRILSSNFVQTIDMIEPNDKQLAKYKGIIIDLVLSNDKIDCYYCRKISLACIQRSKLLAFNIEFTIVHAFIYIIGRR